MVKRIFKKFGNQIFFRKSGNQQHIQLSNRIEYIYFRVRH